MNELILGALPCSPVWVTLEADQDGVAALDPGPSVHSGGARHGDPLLQQGVTWVLDEWVSPSGKLSTCIH